MADFNTVDPTAPYPTFARGDRIAQPGTIHPGEMHPTPPDVRVQIGDNNTINALQRASHTFGTIQFLVDNTRAYQLLPVDVYRRSAKIIVPGDGSSVVTVPTNQTLFQPSPNSPFRILELNTMYVSDAVVNTRQISVSVYWPNTNFAPLFSKAAGATQPASKTGRYFFSAPGTGSYVASTDPSTIPQVDTFPNTYFPAGSWVQLTATGADGGDSWINTQMLLAPAAAIFLGPEPKVDTGQGHPLTGNIEFNYSARSALWAISSTSFPQPVSVFVERYHSGTPVN